MIVRCDKFVCFLFFFLDFIYLFLERRREGEWEGEKHQCVVAPHTPRAGDLAHNPGTYPDWEWNRRPLDLQAGTQSTEPHQPGRFCFSFSESLYCSVLFSSFVLQVWQSGFSLHETLSSPSSWSCYCPLDQFTFLWHMTDSWKDKRLFGQCFHSTA